MNPLACALTVAFAVGGGGQPGTRPFETIMQDDALLLHRPAREVRKTAARMRDLGVDRVRITAGWSAIAPQPDASRRPPFEARNPRDYPKGSWTALDRAVKEVVRAGMRPMLDVGFFAPRWAVKRPSADHHDRWRPSGREFAQFAEAVARRYSGGFHDAGGALPAVRLFTTWNEPNHPVFLQPQWQRTGRRGWRPLAPHLYRRMHQAAYDAIKRVNPDDRVLIGGLAEGGSRSRGPREGIAPLRFIREMSCVDRRLRRLRVPECRGFRPLRADGFAIHPYTRVGPPSTSSAQPDNVKLANLDRLSGLLAELGRRGRISTPLPIFVTEYGYETNPPDPTGVAPEQQAQYLGQAAYLAWRRPDVRSFAQFLLEDIGPQGGSPRHRWDDYQTGLMDYLGRGKPSLQAFRLPFWVQPAIGDGGLPGLFVFGQVRPGSGNRQVQIQVRVQGRRPFWHAIPSTPLWAGTRSGCGSFATDQYGFFTRFLPLARPGSYRFVWGRAAGRLEPSFPLDVEPSLPRPLAELVRPAG